MQLLFLLAVRLLEGIKFRLYLFLLLLEALNLRPELHLVVGGFALELDDVLLQRFHVLDYFHRFLKLQGSLRIGLLSLSALLFALL
mmetsp:Transcript_7138/g.9951  ORF Transcript_7138/g.9951 Transcript_7138/m.9951 type:complete len:86 (-) Transcript_7138:629-886(-)